MRSSLLDNLVWGILLLLLVPSGLVVASWNSLPGSRLYKMKLTMEQGLVAVMPSYEVKGSLQVAFTERRFSEAKRLLADKSSVEGLSYLNEQVTTTKQAIKNAPTTQMKRELAQKYITTLQNVNTQLEEQKQVYANIEPSSSSGAPVVTRAPVRTSTPTPTPTRTPTVQPAAGTTVRPVTPTHTPTPIPPTLTPIPTSTEESSQTISDEITDTQEEIEDVIDELEETISESEEEDRSRGQGDEHRNEGNREDKDKDK